MKLKILLTITVLWNVLCAPGNLSARSPESFTTGSSLYFIENSGQITDQFYHPRTDIDFRIPAGNGLNVFLGKGKIHYQWSKVTQIGQELPVLQDDAHNVRTGSVRKNKKSIQVDMFRVDVELIGGNRNAPVVVEGKQNFYERYFLPWVNKNNSSEGVKAYSYSKLTYENVYPNIDWVFYFNNKGKLEHDFIVRPGGKVSDIKMRYNGAISLKLNNDGSLTANTLLGSITENAPYSFGENGEKVNSRFDLEGNVVSFKTGDYQGTLTIDPTIEWATYFGGDGFFDAFRSVEANKKGEVYGIGNISSLMNIATAGSFQTNIAGMVNAFIVKFNAAGVRQWGTYYGGSSEEYGFGIALDTLGNIFCSGLAYSTGLATNNSYQPSLSGGGDAFLVKFDSSGARQWATYYGGSDEESYPYIASDGNSIYLAGMTWSTNNIATPGSFQDAYGGTINGWGSNSFLAKFGNNGVREWATYYRGNKGVEGSLSVTCDMDGNVYIAGGTESESGIATPGSYQDKIAGGYDLFLAKFDKSGDRAWSTYIGGIEDEYSLEGHMINCDDGGNIYLAGRTNSNSGIATPGSHQATMGGGSDVFVMKFDGKGQKIWGTYYGGSEDEARDVSPSVVCGNSNSIYITGSTESTANIATADAYQRLYGGNSLGAWGDAFLAKFSPEGKLLYGTYFGGSDGDIGTCIATDHYGMVYLAGCTNSHSGIATPGSHLDTFPDPNTPLYNYYPFLAKFCLASVSPAIDITGPDSICAYNNETYSILPVENAETYIWTLPPGWQGNSDSNSINIVNDTEGGEISVKVVICNDTSEAIIMDVFVLPPDIPVISVDDSFTLRTVKPYTSYQWLLNDTLIEGATHAEYRVTENGNYRVIVTNEYGCVDTSDIYEIKNVVSIPGLDVPGRIIVYPNPASNKIIIRYPETLNIVLSSIDGKELLRSAGKNEIDIQQLPDGIYMLGIFDGNNIFLKTEKIIKMKK